MATLTTHKIIRYKDEQGREFEVEIPNDSRAVLYHPTNPDMGVKVTGPTHDPYYLRPDGSIFTPKRGRR
jgi:hypothetical protein